MLITNGCSFVWGDELDGHDNDPPTHTHLTFTHKLASLLDLPYENLAKCGNGNDKIFRDTIVRLNELDKPMPTHVVILWSAWQRHEYANILNRNGYKKFRINVEDCMIQFSPERTGYISESHWGSINEYFNEIYTVRTSIIQHLSMMLSMQRLCDSMGVKLIQGAFHHRMIKNLASVLNTDEPEWKEYNDRIRYMLSLLRDTSKVGLGYWKDMYSTAIDTEGFSLKPAGHPCEKTHHEYSKLLHHIFTNHFT